jgi:hypothetical protein
MLENDKKHLRDLEKNTFDWPWTSNKPDNFMWSHETSGSGGYSDYIFKYAAKHLFGQDLKDLQYKNLRYDFFHK